MEMKVAVILSPFASLRMTELCGSEARNLALVTIYTG